MFALDLASFRVLSNFGGEDGFPEPRSSSVLISCELSVSVRITCSYSTGVCESQEATDARRSRKQICEAGQLGHQCHLEIFDCSGERKNQDAASHSFCAVPWQLGVNLSPGCLSQSKKKACVSGSH